MRKPMKATKKICAQTCRTTRFPTLDANVAFLQSSERGIAHIGRIADHIVCPDVLPAHGGQHTSHSQSTRSPLSLPLRCRWRHPKFHTRVPSSAPTLVWAQFPTDLRDGPLFCPRRWGEGLQVGQVALDTCRREFRGVHAGVHPQETTMPLATFTQRTACLYTQFTFWFCCGTKSRDIDRYRVTFLNIGS